LLSKDDAWALRELILPWGVPSADGKPTEKMQHMVMDFTMRLYESLLHIEVEGRGEWNMGVTLEDCLVINQFVKAGQWETGDGILVQSWMVLHELERPGEPLSVPSETPFTLLEEEPNAVHPEGESSLSGDRVGDAVLEDPDFGGAELRDHKAAS
jgi:hypothetical protein